MIVSILAFIVILALLVLVHEFGHFVMAKRAGMKVDEFGFGFPPRLIGIKKGETIYSINLIPLGGFVKIVGEDNSGEADPRSFINKSFWQRLSTLVAGVVMNFILAWVLLSIGFGIGLPTVVGEGQQLPKYGTLSSQNITILEVSAESPAKVAGIKEGDIILGADGKSFSDIESLISYVRSRGDQTIDMQLKRGGEEIKISVLSRANPPEGEGSMGIGLGNVGEISYPWYYAPVAGLKATLAMIKGTAVGFYELIVQGVGIKSLGGPVKIAALTGQVTELGFPYLIQFTAFLSVNLGILNIIPFPALDGGRVLFLLIEKVRGKRNNSDWEKWANTIGFALLLLLIAVITFGDIKSLIR